jgi:hypothetical protein
MPGDDIRHFVFVDFENVPNIDLGLVEGQPVHVTVLIGKKQTKLDLALVQQIHRLAGQVTLVEVGASGRNALDLTLACYLGQAIQRGRNGRFSIVSKDKDFEPMISHLHGGNVNVSRHDSFAAVFQPSAERSAAAKSAIAIKKIPENRRNNIIARIKNPVTKNRPSTEKALLAHIITSLGKEASEAKAREILKLLLDQRIVTIDDKGKVTYLPS